MMRILSLISVVILFAACGGAPEEETAATVEAPQAAAIEAPSVRMEASSSYEVAYADAVAAIDRAASKGHAWTTSDQMIKDAAEAAANGDTAVAISLADEARIQADLASIQADHEALNWRDNVISK